MSIIDCHVHLNNYNVDQKIPTEENLATLRSQMEKWQLDHVIVLSSYRVDEHRPSAARLVELIGGDPRIHLVEGLGVTADTPVPWESVEARLRSRQTIGLKIYPGYEHVFPTDRVFRPAIELCSRYKVPLMIHTGDTYAPKAKLKYAHPLEVDDLCVDYPDVQFVICHLGNPWFRDVAEILYKNANAFADISGLVLEEFDTRLEEVMREELGELVLYSGEPEKILFGTDWPLVRMGPYLRFVEHLELPAEHRRLLMFQNAARLFRIKLGEAEVGKGVGAGSPTQLEHSSRSS